MENSRKIVLEQAILGGACAVGITSAEMLAGGPESTDISKVLPGAKSAISFAYTLDTDAILSFLSKKDRSAHEQNNIAVNNIVSGAALNMAGFIEMKGFKSVPVIANNYYRTDTPGSILDMFPDISLRYLAVRAGVGYFGLSGNVITPKEGAAVILGAIITTADFQPTELLPPEGNYCDGCRLCMATCASGLMDREVKTTINMGGTEFSHSKRKSYLRCEYVCGGFTGLHPSGKWSKWSPGRFPIPENDKEFLPALINGITNYSKWPDMGGGYYHSLSPYKMFLTCGNCQLICHPDKEERKRRYQILKDSGVVIQHENGSLEGMSPDKARKMMEDLPRERRALYENV